MIAAARATIAVGLLLIVIVWITIYHEIKQNKLREAQFNYGDDHKELTEDLYGIEKPESKKPSEILNYKDEPSCN